VDQKSLYSFKFAKLSISERNIHLIINLSLSFFFCQETPIKKSGALEIFLYLEIYITTNKQHHNQKPWRI
jgi:hypothetical protein